MRAFEIILSVILILSACSAFLFGVLQLAGRGRLLNNLYPAEQENKPDPKPYYRQSGILLLMTGVMMLLNAAAILLRSSRLTLCNAVLIPAVVIYAIVSTTALNKNK